MKKFTVKCRDCGKRVPVISNVVFMRRMYMTGWRVDPNGRILCPECAWEDYKKHGALSGISSSILWENYVDWWNRSVRNATERKNFSTGCITSMHLDKRTGKYIET